MRPCRASLLKPRKVSVNGVASRTFSERARAASRFPIKPQCTCISALNNRTLGAAAGEKKGIAAGAGGQAGSESRGAVTSTVKVLDQKQDANIQPDVQGRTKNVNAKENLGFEEAESALHGESSH